MKLARELSNLTTQPTFLSQKHPFVAHTTILHVILRTTHRRCFFLLLLIIRCVFNYPFCFILVVMNLIHCLLWQMMTYFLVISNYMIGTCDSGDCKLAKDYDSINKQLWRDLCSIPLPTPRILGLNFLPDAGNQTFIYLVGLEEIVQERLKETQCPYPKQRKHKCKGMHYKHWHRNKSESNKHSGFCCFVVVVVCVSYNLFALQC